MLPNGLGGLVPAGPGWPACFLLSASGALAGLLGPVCLQLAGYLPGSVWPACWVAWVAQEAWAHKKLSIYQNGMRQDMRPYAPNQHVTLAPGLLVKPTYYAKLKYTNSENDTSHFNISKRKVMEL